VALAALRETLRTMSARLIDDACISLPLLGSGLSEDGIVQHGEMRATLIRALTALRAQARSGRPDGPAFDLR
jgi:chromate reductase